MGKCQSVSPGRKFDQAVRGATAIFLRDGFAGASVDDIAAAAHVSKATLYSYFPDKTAMYQEAMRAQAAQFEESFALDIAQDLGPDQAIPLMAARIAAWMADPARIGFLRLHLAEAGRIDPLPGSGQDRLTGLLQAAVRPHLDRWVQDGQLALDDTGLATRQLIALASAGLLESLLFGGQAQPADVEAAARSAAQLFLRAARPLNRPNRRRSAGADANVTAGMPSQAAALSVSFRHQARDRRAPRGNPPS